VERVPLVFLKALPTPSGQSAVDLWSEPLTAALAGNGPALVPVPDGPAGAAITKMARLDEPLEVPDAALVVPTSGSTGVPKGALLTRSALRASSLATLDRIGGPGGWLLALPVTHIAGLNVLTRAVLGNGPTVAMDLADGFTPEGFVAATQRLRAVRRYTALVPTQLSRLLDGGGEAIAALASYDAVLLGGAAASPELLKRAAAVGATITTTYGMSETCGGCVYDGVPLDGVLVDLDKGRIALGGDSVFSGYRLRPDLTAEALEVREGVRWHLTRDAGRWADGRLDILGRIDDMITTGAEKVAPLAVESALAALPGIREAVVIGVPDDEWGQAVAAVVTADREFTLDEIRDALRPALPGYALPRRLLVLDRIPLIGTGKPDRIGLRNSFLSP
jgi:O-succinylbenzoic acid--CoA ligase